MTNRPRRPLTIEIVVQQTTGLEFERELIRARTGEGRARGVAIWTLPSPVSGPVRQRPTNSFGIDGSLATARDTFLALLSIIRCFASVMPHTQNYGQARAPAVHALLAAMGRWGLLRLRLAMTVAGQSIEKLVPQPQADLAFGLRTAKWLPISSSV